MVPEKRYVTDFAVSTSSYPPNTAESISRRLGDFAFMLRDYKLASTVYDSIRRDFIQDGAVKLGAAATVSDLDTGEVFIR